MRVSAGIGEKLVRLSLQAYTVLHCLVGTTSDPVTRLTSAQPETDPKLFEWHHPPRQTVAFARRFLTYPAWRFAIFANGTHARIDR
jgi:hypothetical protein